MTVYIINGQTVRHVVSTKEKRRHGQGHIAATVGGIYRSIIQYAKV